MGVPETLVQRSAEARAKATGSDADSILEAWAGGEAAPSAPSTPAAPAEVETTPEPAPEMAPEPSPEPTPAPAAAATATVPAAPVAVMDAPPPVEDEPVVAAPLSERIAIAARVGAVAGLVLSLVGWVFSAQFMVTSADMIGEEDSLRAAFGVQPGRLVVIALLISAAIGISIAGLCRMIPAWTAPGRRLVGSPLPSLAVGALVGGLVGALLAALMIGLGEPPELPDDPTAVPALAAIVWGVLFWIGGGWLIGAMVQTLGVPDGVEAVDLDEVKTVRSRLVSAFALPVMAAVAILVLVLSFAFVFYSFPSWSPLTGTVIAGSILGFAALSASKPNMKVGLNELFVAAAGIGVVVVLIYGVLQTSGAGHGEEEEGVSEEGTTETTTGQDVPAEGQAPAGGESFVIHLW